ncbi:MAG: hypothetical protein Fues2KO_07870 [Fuerstiella sp.]
MTGPDSNTDPQGDPTATDSSDAANVPRREFLKFASLLSSATAAGIYLATDARSRAHSPVAPLPEDHVDPAHNYAY